jgi:hypothetical protein
MPNILRSRSKRVRKGGSKMIVKCNKERHYYIQDTTKKKRIFGERICLEPVQI